MIGLLRFVSHSLVHWDMRSFAKSSFVFDVNEPVRASNLSQFFSAPCCRKAVSKKSIDLKGSRCEAIAHLMRSFVYGPSLQPQHNRSITGTSCDAALPKRLRSMCKVAVPLRRLM